MWLSLQNLSAVDKLARDAKALAVEKSDAIESLFHAIACALGDEHGRQRLRRLPHDEVRQYLRRIDIEHTLDRLIADAPDVKQILTGRQTSDRKRSERISEAHARARAVRVELERLSATAPAGHSRAVDVDEPHVRGSNRR